MPVKRIKTKVYEVQKTFIKTKDFEILTAPLKHKKVPTNGYVFLEKPKLRIDKNKLKKLKIDSKDKTKLSQLTKGKDIKINNKIIKSKNITYKQAAKKISFIFDTKNCPNAIKLAKNSDLAIMEATFDKEESKLASSHGHLTSEQSAKIAKQAKVKKLILTHISQRYDYKSKNLEKQAQKIFPNTQIAKDLMKVEI